MSSSQPPEPAPAEKPPALVPRDAASLVVLDKVNGETFVLLGKRRSTQRFAPGKYVFPGGSVDEADWDEGLAGDLPASEHGPLAYDIKRYSGRVPPHAFALATSSAITVGVQTPLS